LHDVKNLFLFFTMQLLHYTDAVSKTWTVDSFSVVK